ncbi:hypothetical protein [Clostridium sp. Marseille-Q7071]
MKRNKKGNKDTTNTKRKSKMTKKSDLDPITELFLAIKKNKWKLITLGLNTFLAIFVAIKIITLNLWG